MATLYRKYRPKSFADIRGQKTIVRILSNALKHERIGHAYLFTGSRGTGKTSTARIFAKAILCQNRQIAEPCNACESCMSADDGININIIEIDAASHTGVENIRQLREEIRLAPTRASHKIYIIDEVHMLSTGAFNALLKTLEEPPEHVVFVLATTEIHKVPETIASRCQQFDFVRISQDDIVEKLIQIAKIEGVILEQEAAKTIALAAEGGLRDAESMLAQVMANEDTSITAEEVEKICSLSPQQSVMQFLLEIASKNTPAALTSIQTTVDSGLSVENFIKSCLYTLRQALLARVENHSRSQNPLFDELTQKMSINRLLTAIEELLTSSNKVKLSFLPQLPLEIAVVRLCAGENIPANSVPESMPTSSTQTPVKTQKLSPTPPSPTRIEHKSESLSPSKKEIVHETNTPQPSNTRKSLLSLEIIQRSWPKCLVELRSGFPSIAVFLASCKPENVEGKAVIISTPYGFYKDKLEESKNRLTIERVIGTIIGTDVTVQFIVSTLGALGTNNSDTAQTQSDKQSSDNLVADVLDVFGGTIAS